MKAIGTTLALLALGWHAHAENAVVGSGTPASCSTAAYNAAIALVINDNQGGALTLNCGLAPHTININTSHSSAILPATMAAPSTCAATAWPPLLTTAS